MSNYIGPFEMVDPLPELREPRMLVALQPWIDVGSVATMALAYLGEALQAAPLGHLARPGHFFDFTRYRPMLTRNNGERQVSVPNTRLHYANGTENDWILLHTLEPHANGDEFVEGLSELVVRLGVREYTMIGSMYAPVPHTRRPLVSGGASSPRLRERLATHGIRESNYEGPTTILAVLGATVPEQGIDTATVILQLPAYAQVERDYMGLQSLLELLTAMFGFRLDMAPVRDEAERQRQALDETAAEDPRLQVWLKELERTYDAEHSGEPDVPSTPLSPELESFLRDVESRFPEN